MHVMFSSFPDTSNSVYLSTLPTPSSAVRYPLCTPVAVVVPLKLPTWGVVALYYVFSRWISHTTVRRHDLVLHLSTCG